MAEYITSVVEIREAGVPVKAEGEHVVRVLGALKQVAFAEQSGSKESLAAGDASEISKYLSGQLAPPPPDADAPDEPFAVPQAVVMADGRIGFLKRGGAS